MDTKTFETEVLDLTEFVNSYEAWKIKVMFPEYNGQTFAEKVEELSKAKQAGLIDTALAVENKLYGNELTVEEKKEVIQNAKLENGITLLENDVIE